ncbi:MULTISPECIES: hypothetical protein [unclassified Variovorax]|uniref:hypothetical protein n=1 Tax=unclassified Variovorax TaxID=663243 RepID=UPI00076CD6D2|nr:MULTISPECIES: hypothetical protein [unclassified Variovorax]KWT70817.1 hypothetical protein APY03_6573 [Variovorax sp. WDL1]PNG49184.1 hypothetical protein CHC06_06421 [Variovorax sp. B2]PNG49569.1 hypothetical protein CHC07_06478 [Variovorax sp. B4]VTV18771.1 hypothetical protein WDL1P2_00419 [Variovorax sp. WDL1]
MTEIDEAIAQHPYMLHIERIVRMAPKMTDAEREALADWAEDAVESFIPFDASNWPGWQAVARRLAH